MKHHLDWIWCGSQIGFGVVDDRLWWKYCCCCCCVYDFFSYLLNLCCCFVAIFSLFVTYLMLYMHGWAIQYVFVYDYVFFLFLRYLCMSPFKFVLLSFYNFCPFIFFWFDLQNMFFIWTKGHLRCWTINDLSGWSTKAGLLLLRILNEELRPT